MKIRITVSFWLGLIALSHAATANFRIISAAGGDSLYLLKNGSDAEMGSAVDTSSLWNIVEVDSSWNHIDNASGESSIRLTAAESSEWDVRLGPTSWMWKNEQWQFEDAGDGWSYLVHNQSDQKLWTDGTNAVALVAPEQTGDAVKWKLVETNVIIVSETPEQPLRFGIDAERLWFWNSNMSNELAQAAVVDLQSDFVRVAVNCAYEREEGVKQPEKYDKIIAMMTSLTNANPNIKFFASPRPLDEAYTAAEEDLYWGGDCPWAPYPGWILTWVENGTNTNGDTKWKVDTLHTDKLAQYYADYINLMHAQGFEIHYLDLTNEKNFTSDQMEDVVIRLPGLLDTGAAMPQIVAPSTWSHQQGTDWITSANSNIFDVAASHNTSEAGSPEAFAAAGHTLGKEVWNSELHGWKGTELEDEILNSRYLWEHLRAGFNGIDTWLFFGPINGHTETMIWCNSSEVRRSGKYEIFRKLVNNSNGGNYLDVEMINESLLTTAFLKDDILTVWALNLSSNAFADIDILLPGRDLYNSLVEVTRWHSSLAQAGEVSMLEVWETDLFSYDLEGWSLYCFKIDLEDPPRSPYGQWLVDAFADAPPGTDDTGSGNPDGDGLSNLQEWALVTDPLTADAPPMNLRFDDPTLIITYDRRIDSGLTVRASWSLSVTSTVWRLHGDGLTEITISSSGDVETVAALVPLDADQKLIRIEMVE